MPTDILSLSQIQADQRRIYGSAPSQFFDVYHARTLAPSASAVFIHGGFWRVKYDLTHATHVCFALAEAGFSVASLEYRRVGENGGGWPGTAEDIHDAVTTAWPFLGARHQPRLVIGHSAGGHLALWLATQVSDITAAIGLAPVACLDLAEKLQLSNNAAREFLNGQDAAPADPSKSPALVPCTLLHGVEDEVVPLELSQKYRERQPKAELIEIPGATHFDLIDPNSSAFPTVLSALRRYSLAKSR